MEYNLVQRLYKNTRNFMTVTQRGSKITDSQSFKSKRITRGKTPADGSRNEVEKAVPSKHLLKCS